MFEYNVSMRVYDWEAIQEYHEAGHSFVECQRQFGFSQGAWAKAIARGEIVVRFRRRGVQPAPQNDRRRKYDWLAVQAYYDAGHSYRECKARFGFCAETWTKAVKRGELKARARSKPLQILLSTTKSRAAVKRRLLSEGLLVNQCSKCGLQDWLGMQLSMHIDHINGDNQDHRLENLRMLCPNCHSQTDTYAGRNAKRRLRLQDPRAPV